MTFDTRAFRTALGCFPTGVAVVTAESHDLHPKGITVNSFTSVSLDPPLVLWCVGRGSDRCETFMTARGFTVSILDAAHRGLSARLARRGEHRLDGIALLPTELGAPALAEALAVFECARESVYQGGDHAILLGRVLRFSFRKAGAPLVFFRGRYVGLADREAD